MKLHINAIHATEETDRQLEINEQLQVLRKL